MKPARDEIMWPDTLAVFDIEVVKWINVRCLCHVDQTWDEDSKRWLPGNRKLFTQPEDYVDWVFSFDFRGDVVWAHWGGKFDMLFLLPIFHKRGWSTRAFLSNSQVVVMEVKTPDGILMKFADSSRLLPDSVEKIGKSVGLPKLDADRKHIDTVPWDELVKYCYRDCDIVLKGLQNMRKVMTHEGFDFSFTLATQVTRRIRKSDELDMTRFYERDENGKMKPNKLFQLADRFAEHAYCAGRTEVFVRWTTRKKLYHYDITSAYPWAMTHALPAYFEEIRPGPKLSDPLPAAFFSADEDVPPLYAWPETPRDTERYLKVCGVSQAWVSIPPGSMKYPLLFTHEENENLLIFPEGMFSGVWTNIELLALYQHMKAVPGFRLFITSQAVYKPVAFMRGLIMSLWKRRLAAIERGDEFEKYAFKIAMNSAYGKLAEQPEKFEVLMGAAARAAMHDYDSLDLEGVERERKRLRKEYESLGLPPLQRSYSMPGVVQATRIPGLYTLATEREGGFRHAAAAAYVTAMTRIKLWDAFIEAERQASEVYYCDTDSIIVDKPIFGEGFSELGQWKLEATISELEILAPKVYRYIDGDGTHVYRAKGMPIIDGGKVSPTDKDFAARLERASETWDRFTGKVYGRELPKPEKDGLESLRARIQAGNLEPAVKVLERQLQRTDRKREHFSGTSRPLVYSGGRDNGQSG